MPKCLKCGKKTWFVDICRHCRILVDGGIQHAPTKEKRNDDHDLLAISTVTANIVKGETHLTEHYEDCMLIPYEGGEHKKYGKTE